MALDAAKNLFFFFSYLIIIDKRKLLDQKYSLYLFSDISRAIRFYVRKRHVPPSDKYKYLQYLITWIIVKLSKPFEGTDCEGSIKTFESTLDIEYFDDFSIEQRSTTRVHFFFPRKMDHEEIYRKVERVFWWKENM